MNPTDRSAAGAEWRAHWPVVLAALIGYSLIGLQSYGFSPFVSHVEKEFGWTRAQAMTGVSISNGVGIFLNIIIGIIIDRFGSRRVAIAGVIVMTGSFALFSTATGSMVNWMMLWFFLAIGVVLVQATVWTRVIAARFDRSRGVALAVVLTGTPISAMILPVLATWLIAGYGWRGGFIGVGAIWVVVALPIVYLLFRDLAGTHSRGGSKADGSPAGLPGLTFREGIRTKAFLRLLISFGCFSFYSMTIATNLVPLLTEKGAGGMQAASLASIMGIVGIAARLSVGFLLDRMPGHIIGTVTLLLPVIGCGILIMDPGTIGLGIAMALFGAAIGAEIDVALYLASRHFGMRSFGTLFSAIITFGAVNAAAGPFIAGTLHDSSGNYNSLLVVIMVIMTIGALSMTTIGKTPREWAEDGSQAPG